MNLMVSVIAISLVGGLFYWLFVLKNKSGNLKCWFKYKLMKKQYDPRLRDYILSELEKDKKEGEFHRELLLTNMLTPEKIQEMIYIYRDLKKQVKGGKNKKENGR